MFLREALHRLFHRRGAWVWLLAEPMAHIAFLLFVFAVMGVRHVGGIESPLWLMVGLLGFFMFKRTMTIAMGAVTMAKPLFAYRQVKPIDAVLVRAASEGVLVGVISIVFLVVAALFGVDILADDWLRVLAAFLTLWLLGLGFGLVLSVPRELAAEVGDIVNIVTTPLYLLSGVMFPLAAVPQPYRDWLLLNPVAHPLEHARQGFAAHYVAVEGIELAYPLMVAFIAVLLGLALHRVFHSRLIAQ
jgi:capsular polysaccharide transport system permease protein